MVNILSGGLHAGRQIEFQDFLVVPHGCSTFEDALAAAVGVHRSMRELLVEDGRGPAGVADEGGWGPRLDSNEQALEYMVRAIERAGYGPGSQISIAIDAAATHFYQGSQYRFGERGSLLGFGWHDRALRALDRCVSDRFDRGSSGRGRLDGLAACLRCAGLALRPDRRRLARYESRAHGARRRRARRQFRTGQDESDRNPQRDAARD